MKWERNVHLVYTTVIWVFLICAVKHNPNQHRREAKTACHWGTEGSVVMCSSLPLCLYFYQVSGGWRKRGLLWSWFGEYIAISPSFFSLLSHFVGVTLTITYQACFLSLLLFPSLLLSSLPPSLSLLNVLPMFGIFSSLWVSVGSTQIKKTKQKTTPVFPFPSSHRYHPVICTHVRTNATK